MKLSLKTVYCLFYPAFNCLINLNALDENQCTLIPYQQISLASKSFITSVTLLSYFANFTAASFFLCLVENKILFTNWNNKLKTKE